MASQILVVEDIEITRRQLTKLILESFGQDAEVDSAATTNEAIAAVDRQVAQNGRYTAGIFDVMIPRQQGLTPEVASQAVAHFARRMPTALVLFISAYDTKDTAREMQAA